MLLHSSVHPRVWLDILAPEVENYGRAELKLRRCDGSRHNGTQRT